MTAAKVMDIIARLPDCAGQAADAVSAYTQVKMEDAPKIAQHSEVKMSRHVDTSSTTHGPNHGLTLKIHWILSNEICTDTSWHASCGKDSLRRFY